MQRGQVHLDIISLLQEEEELDSILQETFQMEVEEIVIRSPIKFP